jgi:hypothetical protein
VGGRSLPPRRAALAALLLATVAPARADDAERLRRAADHLIASQRESGLFAYDFDVASAEPSGRDNLVRQAGALAALGEYAADTGDRRALPALRAGLDALAARSLRIRPGRLDAALAALGLRPRGATRLVAEGGRPDGAPAGATALALVAALEHRRASADARYAALAAAWARGLRALRVRGGIREHPGSRQRSPYFDGEAWLALALLDARAPGEADGGETLRELERQLMEHYGREPSVSFYHWGAMASAERYRATADPAFVEFAAGQARFALAALPPSAVRRHNACYLVEGLAPNHALVAARPEHAALAEQIRGRVAAELARARALQLEPGQERMTLAEGGWLVAPVLRQHAGAFLAGPHRPYLRIDYTQHCLSALLKARRYGLSGAPEGAPERPDGV